MSRQELMEEMEEIQLRWYNTFKGTNEADLMIREEIADLLLPLIASKEEEIKEFAEWVGQKYKKGECVGVDGYNRDTTQYSGTGLLTIWRKIKTN